jgi:hypothetical protein
MTAQIVPPARPASAEQSAGDSFDDGEWLEWQQWKAIEEYQDLIDGLSGARFQDDSSEHDSTEDTLWGNRVTQRLRRQGLQADS